MQKQEQVHRILESDSIKRRGFFEAILVLLFLLTVMAFFLSVCVGVAGSSVQTVVDSLIHYDSSSTMHHVIRELRIPRALGAILVGAALSVAGAIMQVVGDNPLADTGLLGINAGAGFMVSLAMVFFPSVSFLGVMGFSVFGAAIGTVLTYGFSGASKKRITPVRLILAGSAVSAFLTALSQGISLCFGTSKDLSYWQSGSLSGLRWNQVMITAPWILLGLLLGGGISSGLTILSMGDETAVSLGAPVQRLRLIGIITTLLLAGTSVSLAGGISFLGLIVPHIMRKIMGGEYSKVIPASVFCGAIIMLLADVVGRMLNAPYDTPVGALVSVIGLPFFLGLTYKKRGEKKSE